MEDCVAFGNQQLFEVFFPKKAAPYFAKLTGAGDVDLVDACWFKIPFQVGFDILP
jgi:hypothetical protein